jgi:hypothetical protein
MHNNDKRGGGQPQEPVTGLEGRDAFIYAILAHHDMLTPLELRAAIALGMHLNCTTGQCNPGYPRLAREIGCTTRSARRVAATLIALGIVEEERGVGGHHENKTNFRLFMPRRVSAIRTPVRQHGRVSAIESPVQTGTGVQARSLDGCPSSVPGRVSIRGPHNTESNTERNTDRGAPQGARPVHGENPRVERVEGTDHKIGKSAPNGAFHCGDSPSIRKEARSNQHHAEQRESTGLPSVTVTAGAADQECERAFNALVSIYPYKLDGGDSRGLFDRMLAEGIHPQLIIAAVDPSIRKPMSMWLYDLWQEMKKPANTAPVESFYACAAE